MSTQNNNTLVIMRQPPMGSTVAREAIDALLTLAAFGQDVSLVLLDDAVLHLLNPEQTREHINRSVKAINPMLEALPLYDVDQLYVDQQALDARQMNADHHPLNWQRLRSTEDLKRLIAGHARVLCY